MSDQPTTIATVECRSGTLIVTEKDNKFTIEVGGVVRHPDCSPEAVVRAMAHYFSGAEYSLMKRAEVRGDEELRKTLYSVGMTGPRHGLTKWIGDLVLEAYVALGGTFDHLQVPEQKPLSPVLLAIAKLNVATANLQQALEWETVRQRVWEEVQQEPGKLDIDQEE